MFLIRSEDPEVILTQAFNEYAFGVEQLNERSCLPWPFDVHPGEKSGLQSLEFARKIAQAAFALDPTII